MSVLDIAAIEGHLFAIPQREFRKLVRTLEGRLDDPQQAVAAAALLGRMRPRLVVDRPPRRPTVKRLFCRPFADLLWSGKQGARPAGRIPRSAVGPAFDLFAEAIGADALAGVRARLGRAPDDATAVDGIARHLWSAGAKALDEALAAAGKKKETRQALVARLGSGDTFEAVKEIAGMLTIADAMVGLSEALPPGLVRDVDEIAEAAFEEALTRAGTRGRQYQLYVVFLLMARLETPGSIFPLLERLAEDKGLELDGAVMGFTQEVVVADVESGLGEIRAGTGGNATDVSAGLVACHARYVSARQAMEAQGGRGNLRRLDRVGEGLARSIEEMLVGSGAGAVPVSQTAMLAAPVDAGAPPDDKAFEETHDRVVALRLAAGMAGSLGIGDAVSKELERVEKGVAQRADGLLQQIRAGAAADPAAAAAAKENVFATVRLMELSAGPDKADAVRRQLMEALGRKKS